MPKSLRQNLAEDQLLAGFAIRSITGLSDDRTCTSIGEKAGISEAGPADSGPFAGGRHVVVPIRCAELLARPEDGHRLPGAGADSAIDRRSGVRDLETMPVLQQNGETNCCCEDVAELKAGTMPGAIRPLQHAPASQPDGQYPRRRSGPGGPAGCASHRKDRRAAQGSDRRDSRPDSRHAADASTAWRSGSHLAVVVIFLLLAANFQSFRLALVTVSLSPAAVAGVVVACCWSPARR